MSEAPPKRYPLPRSHRLGGQNAFKAVFDAGMRKNAGPLSIYSCPNDRPHLRLGVSVSKRVGIAVKRNRIKRLLREAFRLMQHDFPAGYDIVCVVKPHDEATLAEYQRLLFSAVRSSHLEWQRRAKRT